MAILKINHHTFTVSDMDVSIRFYRDLLGFRLTQDVLRENEPAYDRAMNLAEVKVRVAILMDPGESSMIALLQYHHPQPIVRPMGNQYVGQSVLAMRVTEIDAEYERLKEAGVKFNSPPVDVVRQGKPAARLTYAHDPDGIVIELYQPAG